MFSPSILSWISKKSRTKRMTIAAVVAKLLGNERSVHFVTNTIRLLVVVQLGQDRYFYRGKTHLIWILNLPKLLRYSNELLV